MIKKKYIRNLLTKMKHFMSSMLKAVAMAVGIRNYMFLVVIEMKLKCKLSILILSLKSFLWERTIPMVMTQ